MDISKAMSLCIENGIKVYPLRGYIFVEQKGKQTIKYEKRLTDNKEISEAVEKTYIYKAKKLIEGIEVILELD